MNEAEHAEQHNDGLLLGGIDGANLLAFLATLGTLRGLTIVWPEHEVKLWWEPRDAWRPRLSIDGAPPSRKEALSGLADFAELRPGHAALDIGDNLTVAPDAFRSAATDAAHTAAPSPSARAAADFIAGFGCEAVTERNRSDRIQDTALRTLRGAGHQHFLKTMRDLAERAAADNFDRCLFQTWTRSDRRLSLRWDPEDDRRYALRWRNPTAHGEEPKTEWGANRLAFEAIPLFPTAPVGRRLDTTGFRGTRASDTFFTWPIWDVPVNLDTVRSTLAMAELQQRQNPSACRRLAAMGIREVFQSQRMNAGRYRNFSPARSV